MAAGQFSLYSSPFSFDTPSFGPIDYSLKFDGIGIGGGRAGLGFRSPSAPSLDEMGGGTGLTASASSTMLGVDSGAVSQPSLYQQFGQAMRSVGPALAIGGAISSAIGTYFQGQVQKIQMQAQAEQLKFNADMAEINAKMAENQAQSLLLQGERQIGQLTMKAGKIKSAQRASMAANGIDLSEGSAAEVLATTDLMKETDALTINANAVMAAGNARMQRVNYSNSALVGRATASGIEGVARTINPTSMGISSLMSNATSVAGLWFRDPKYGTYAGA